MLHSENPSIAMSLLRYLRRFRRRTLCLVVFIYWACTFTIIYQVEWNKTSKESRLKEQLFKQWRDDKHDLCGGKFAGYIHQFAMLQQVLVDKEKFVNFRKGGENMSQVINQPEDVEYFRYKPGAFQIGCQSMPLSYLFGFGNHLNDWIGNLTSVDEFKSPYTTDKTFTIAIQRYEYADLFRTMTDWYNAFMIMNFFNQTSLHTNILLVDAHPSGVLDSTWSVLFNRVQRLTSLQTRTVFTQLTWGMLGYSSPLTQLTFTMPLLSEFRRFFLRAHHVMPIQTLDCNWLKIVFVWRRDLILHPRNPSGVVTGKIKNEKELLAYFQARYPGHDVRGIQLEALNVTDQIHLTSRTDILIGMSGAALSHVLFLPQHAGMLQLYTRRPASDPLRNLARARRLKYEYWAQDYMQYDTMDADMEVPPKKIHPHIKRIIGKMC